MDFCLCFACLFLLLNVYNQTRIAIVIIMIGIWTMLLILSRYVGEGMHIICILNIYYDTTSTQWRDVVVISLLLSSIVSTLLAFISFVDRAFDTK